jgi:hypothetical protein
MDIAAILANETDCGSVSPIKSKKCCSGCIELGFPTLESIAITDHTMKITAKHFYFIVVVFRH